MNNPWKIIADYSPFRPERVTGPEFKWFISAWLWGKWFLFHHSCGAVIIYRKKIPINEK